MAGEALLRLKRDAPLGDAYRAVRKLGEGQFAEVWEVVDAAGGRVRGVAAAA